MRRLGTVLTAGERPPPDPFPEGKGISRLLARGERIAGIPGGPVVLAGAAVATEAIYLAGVFGPLSLLDHGAELTDLGELTGRSPTVAVLVTTGLVGLFVLYGCACLAIARSRSTTVALPLVATVLFSGTLVFLYPATAMDVYNYVVQGHVLAYEQLNPLVVPPARVPTDSFVAYAGSWAASPSPYGPVWLLLMRAVAAFAGARIIVAVLVVKLISAIAVSATTALLGWHVGRVAPGNGALAAALFGWNPLVEIELVGNGHNDAVMTLLLVAALALLASRHASTAAAALVASALVKYLTAIALPILFLAQLADARQAIGSRLRNVAVGMAVAVVVAAALYAPLWAGPTTLQRLRDVDGNYLSSTSALVILLDPSAQAWLAYPRMLVLAGLIAWPAYRVARGRSGLVVALYDVELAAVLVATHFAGWYLPLLLALAIVSRSHRAQAQAVVFTFVTTLATPLWAYVWPAGQPALSLTTFHLILVPLTFLPPLAVGILWRHDARSRHLIRSALDRVYLRQSSADAPRSGS